MIDRVNIVLEHIKLVREHCIKLGLHFISKSDKLSDDAFMGLSLLRLAHEHDIDKLTVYMLAHLWPESPHFKIALEAHQKANKHHPEYWGKIQDMQRVYVAEMVCDCYARSNQFGTDIRTWFETVATVKYSFTMDEQVGLWITEFLDILLIPKF